jgi:hypothetical protein
MTKLNSIVAGGCLPSFPSSPTQPASSSLQSRMDRIFSQYHSGQLAGTQASQLESIQQGLKDGTISEKEASKLLDQQARIAEATKRAGADGVVTGAEASRIRQMQEQAQSDVFEANSGYELETFFQDPDVRETQAEQVGNIAEGVRSGELSGREAGSLLRQQGRIARSADQLQDGFFGSSDPFAKLGVQMEQWQAGQRIHSEKNDFEQAPHGRLKFPMFF